MESGLVHIREYKYGDGVFKPRSGSGIAEEEEEDDIVINMVYGLWFMAYSLWLIVYGLWFMAYGLWFIV
jgi:hypothetical protein